MTPHEQRQLMATLLSHVAGVTLTHDNGTYLWAHSTPRDITALVAFAKAVVEEIERQVPEQYA